MKAVYIFLVISLSIATNYKSIAQGFEGEIEMSKTEDGQKRVTIFTVKDEIVQVSMMTDNGPARVINNLEKGVTTSLFEKNGQKYAFISRRVEEKEYPLDERQKLIMEMAKNQLKFEVTDETRKIGPYTCTKVLGEDHKEQIEAWVTDEIDLSLMDLFPQQYQTEQSKELDLQMKIWSAGFVVEYWKKSKSTEEIEKVVFNPKPGQVDASVFEYDRDEYYEFDKTTLNNLYVQSAKDPEKMEELRMLLQTFQSSN